MIVLVLLDNLLTIFFFRFKSLSLSYSEIFRFISEYFILVHWLILFDTILIIIIKF